MRKKRKTIAVLHSEEKSRDNNKKVVRIDAKTVIMVSKSISDKEARENFFLKRDHSLKKHEDSLGGRTRNAIKPTEKWNQ